MSEQQQDPAPEPSIIKVPRATDIEANHIICPHCGTANRLNNSQCVHCERDISMLRVLANKARHHFNTALEHAERQRWEPAIRELRNALEIDESFVAAWNVLGTCLAKCERFDEARACWSRSINADPRFAKAHEYLGKVEEVGLAKESREQARRVMKTLRWTRQILGIVVVLLIIAVVVPWVQMNQEVPPPPISQDVLDLQAATEDFENHDWGNALVKLRSMQLSDTEPEVQLLGQAMVSTIETEFMRLESALTREEESGNWRRAMEVSEVILALQPPRALQNRALQSQSISAGRLVQETRGLLGDFAEGRVPASAMMERIDGLVPLMPTDALRAEVASLSASVEAIAQAQRRENFEILWVEEKNNIQDIDSLAWLNRLDELALEWGDQPEVKTEREAVEAQFTAQVMSDWEAANGDLEAVESFREEVGNLSGETSISLEILTAGLMSAEAVLPRLRFVEAQRELQESQEELTAADRITMLDSLDLSVATEEEATHWEAMRQEWEEQAAQERVSQALAIFEDLLEADVAFETLTMEEKLAQTAVDSVDLIIESTPDRFYGRRFRTDYALFYAAQGARKLGDETQEKALWERLLRESPDGDHASQAEARLGTLTEEN